MEGKALGCGPVKGSSAITTGTSYFPECLRLLILVLTASLVWLEPWGQMGTDVRAHYSKARGAQTRWLGLGYIVFGGVFPEALPRLVALLPASTVSFWPFLFLLRLCYTWHRVPSDLLFCHH